MFGNVHITDVRLSIAVWLLTVLLAVGLAATVWHYRATNPPMPGFVRRLLAAARGFAFVVAGLMLASPLLQWTRVREVRPEVLVLEDVSLSMRRVEAGRARWQRASEVVQELQEALGTGTEIRQFAFGITLRPLATGVRDSVEVSDQGTDLSAGLRAVADSLVSRRTVGIVVISDGAYNRGPDPALSATELGVPVWAVCVGDSTVPRDVAIAEVGVPGVAFVGKPTRVRVRLRCSGLLASERLKIVLKAPSRGTVSSAFVKLEPEQVEAQTSLNFVPKDTGFVKLIASVETLPGEVSARNNTAEVFLHVLPRVRTVLLIGSSPNADFGFLRRSLARDSSLVVIPVYEVRPGRLSRALSDSVLKMVQGAILVNFPAVWTPGSVANRVLSGLANSNAPVAVFAQKGFDWKRFRKAYGHATPKNVRRLGERSVDVVLAGEAALHPLLRVSDYRQTTEEAWANVAPVGTAWLVRGLPDSCNLLLSGRFGERTTAALGWTVESGLERVAIFTMSGFWRWRLAPIAYGRQPVVFQNFVKNLGDWLTAPRHVPGFEVRPERQLFDGGEPVVFRARLYDLGLLPVDDAVVTVRVLGQNGEAKQTLLLAGLGNGLYRGQVTALAAGTYAYEAVARAGDRTWGPVRGKFAVKAFAAELSDLRARPEVLRRVAGITSGVCVRSGDLRPLLSAMTASIRQFRDRGVHDEHPGSWSIKASPWLLGTLLGLLALEWTVRRRRGLL